MKKTIYIFGTALLLASCGETDKKAELEALKKHNESDLFTKQAEIEALRRRGVEDQAALNADIEALRVKAEAESKPLQERRDRMQMQLEALRNESQEKLRAAEERISVLRANQESMEKAFLGRKDAVTVSVRPAGKRERYCFCAPGVHGQLLLHQWIRRLGPDVGHIGTACTGEHRNGFVAGNPCSRHITRVVPSGGAVLISLPLH